MKHLKKRIRITPRLLKDNVSYRAYKKERQKDLAEYRRQLTTNKFYVRVKKGAITYFNDNRFFKREAKRCVNISFKGYLGERLNQVLLNIPTPNIIHRLSELNKMSAISQKVLKFPRYNHEPQNIHNR